MDINIKYRSAPRSEGVQPALLPSLTQRHRKHIHLSVGMTARLQPLAELAVMHQESLITFPVYYPSRRRQVPMRQASLRAVRLSLYKLSYSSGLICISGINSLIRAETFKQTLTNGIFVATLRYNHNQISHE
jgi:hypothetical protein